MRVERQDDLVPVGHVAVEVLDHVAVDVRRVHLHRGRQVEDQLALVGRLDGVGDGGADLDGVVDLGAGEALGAVLVEDHGVAHGLLELAAELGGVDGDLLDARLVEAEDDPALEDRRRVVEVDDGPPAALEAFVGPLDELGAALGEHLDSDVVGDEVLFDQLAHEVEVGLAGRGEADLDLLEAHLHDRLEHAPLPDGVHRLDEGLVAVPEVDGAPEGSLLDPLVRPGAVFQHEGEERAVLLERHLLGVRRLRRHGDFLSAATKKPPARRAGGCRRAPISGRPPYVRRSPEVARTDSIALIVRQDRRSVKPGGYRSAGRSPSAWADASSG